MIQAGKKMLFAAAMIEKRTHPDWSDYSCVEEGLFKCAGRVGLEVYYPIEPLVTEFTEYAKKLTVVPNPEPSVARDDTQ